MAVAAPTLDDLDIEFTRPPRSLTQEAFQRLMRNKASVLGIVIIAIFAILTVAAPLIATQDPLKMNSGGKGYIPPIWIKNGLKPTDSRFILGTDMVGRDVFSRVIYGSRVSMLVGFIPTVIILLIGITIGMISGFFGGRVDNWLMRLTDVIYGFPDLLFFIAVLIAMRDSPLGRAFNGLLLLFVAMAIVNWVGVARVVRGQVLSLKEKEFVEAARCIGATNGRIMFRHLFPNILGPLIVLTAFRIPAAIITEAILGYLGLGMKPATNSHSFFLTSWGQLMLEGQVSMNAQPYILLAPAVCVALIMLSFTFLGDGLRDAFDPRMRGTS